MIGNVHTTEGSYMAGNSYMKENSHMTEDGCMADLYNWNQ